MKTKVADLIGRPLAWALLHYGIAVPKEVGACSLETLGWTVWHIGRRHYLFSGNEPDPIVTVMYRNGMWVATVGNFAPLDKVLAGPTALVAGLRCYVAYRAGDEVDIPDRML